MSNTLENFKLISKNMTELKSILETLESVYIFSYKREECLKVHKFDPRVNYIESNEKLMLYNLDGMNNILNLLIQQLLTQSRLLIDICEKLVNSDEFYSTGLKSSFTHLKNYIYRNFIWNKLNRKTLKGVIMNYIEVSKRLYHECNQEKAFNHLKKCISENDAQSSIQRKFII